MVSVTDAELVMLVAHGSALAALGDVVGCAGNVCRVSWCPIALLAPRFEVGVIDENRKSPALVARKTVHLLFAVVGLSVRTGHQVWTRLVAVALAVIVLDLGSLLLGPESRRAELLAECAVLRLVRAGLGGLS